MDIVYELNSHAIAVMLLTLFAFILFTKERFPIETSSLIILVLLTVGFSFFPFVQNNEILHPIDFFSGFGHEALIAVCALMIVGQGLVRTGALEPIGRILSKLWVRHPKLSLLLTLLIGAILSAFVNNVPIVVLLLPILTAVSLRTKTPASKVLMPMGFATLVGGMSTTIGTSTNLLVVSVAVDMGLKNFGMFDFFLPASIAAIIAILYLWIIVPLIMPNRVSPISDTSPRIFTAKLKIVKDSIADGLTIEEIIAKTEGMMTISRLYRSSNDMFIIPSNHLKVKNEDMLLVEDTPENLKKYETILESLLYTNLGEVSSENPLEAKDEQIAEIIISQGSKLNNTTLSRTRFLEKNNLLCLALHKSGRTTQTILKDISEVSLEVGDVILVQGKNEDISNLKRNREVLVLDATSDIVNSEKAFLSFGIMFSVVFISAMGILPIAISAVCGVLLMFLTNCINWKDASNALNTQVVLVVVASLALGQALLKTGAASYLAHLFVSVTDGSSITIMISGLILLMAIMTNIVSNNAAAVIGTPIAIGIAQQLNLPAEPFVLAILFGANMSYATPMAYKTNLLVMTAGGYTFNDFLRIGIPLTIIMWLVFSWILPVLYNLA